MGQQAQNQAESRRTCFFQGNHGVRSKPGQPYVSTMEFDPLRDEGLRYAMGMLEAGVSVELHNYAGTFHGSAFVPSAEPSRRNADEIVAILRRKLHPPRA